MTLVVKVLRTAAEIRAIKDQWQALEHKSTGVELFQSYEWCGHIVDLAATKNDDAAFYVIAAFDDEKLIGLLPLSIWHKKGRKILTGLGEPYQQYTEMLMDPAYDSVKVFNAMQTPLQNSGADYIHLGQVRHDGALFSGSQGYFSHSEEAKAAPFVDLSPWENYDAYFAHLKKATRKRIRNSYNKLERMGELQNIHASEGDVLTAVIDRSYEGRVEWQKRMGLTSRAFQDDKFRAFLDRFKVSKDETVKPIGFCFMLDGVCAAEQWGFVYQDRYYAFISTWNEDLAVAGPGKLHLGEIIKSCYDIGIKYVDFMIPEVQYKMIWATGTVGATDLIKPLSPVGFIYADIWLRKIRPQIKQLMQQLPPERRKKIMDFVFRRK